MCGTAEMGGHVNLFIILGVAVSQRFENPCFVGFGSVYMYINLVSDGD